MLTGHQVDPFDANDQSFASTARAASPVIVGSTDNIDVRNHISFTPIWDQQASDCCAHAAGEGVYAAAAADGHSISPPSRLFLYAIARLLGMLTAPPTVPRPPLEDVGCGLRFMFKGMSGRTFIDANGADVALGVIAESRWPEIAANVNVIPPDDCFRAGENAVIKSYSRIEDGAATPLGLLHALRRLRCPTLCFVVDQKFADVGSGVYDGPGGKVFGGHAMLVVGYSATQRAFLVRNSWGKGFGVDGYAWVSEDFVARGTYDKWVTEVAPEVIS